MIYLDNAATTINKPECVINAVVSAMSDCGNCGRGVNDASLNASRMVYQTRCRVAEFFGASNAEDIVFTANSTEALNIAIKGILNKGDHVITTVMEHNSVLRPLYSVDGIDITFLDTDEAGNVAASQFEQAIKSNTKAIICTHASNLTGNVIDIKAVGEIAKKQGVLFVVDASQSAGEIAIDVNEMNIDILCFTGHKALMGPQGTGGMYVREVVDVKPLLCGGTGVQSYLKEQPSQMPVKLEAGTLNVHGIAGLSAAIEYISNTGIETLADKANGFARKFYEGIKDMPNISIYSDVNAEVHCPIVSFNIGDISSDEIADILYNEYEIACRAGAHCAPLMHKALGTDDRGAVRFSFSHTNTEEEVQVAILAVRQVAAGFID